MIRRSCVYIAHSLRTRWPQSYCQPLQHPLHPSTSRCLVRPFSSRAKKEEAAHDDEEEEAEEEEGATKGGHGSKKLDFKKFKVREHINFLAMPHWNTPDPEFLRLYYVLYFLLSFLVRARRNNRYARFLRVLRTEKVAVAEALPGHIGIAALGQELLHLNQTKYSALSQAYRTQLLEMNPDLAKMRALLQQQAGNPEDSAATYRSLYQNLLVTLHNYDSVRLLDQFRPGRQGLLVPKRSRPPLTRPVDAIPPPEPVLPFLFKRNRVIMYEAESHQDDADEEVSEVIKSGPTSKHRILGTLPNVMPRRQLASYYQLYLTLKKQGNLPPHLKDNPYRAMKSFCRHWISWTLSRQREIAEGQRLAHASTVELAARMVRYHQGLGVTKLLSNVLGVQKAGAMNQGLFEYRENLLKFYDDVLVKYTGYSDDVRRMLKEIGLGTPPTPMELFDSVWRYTFYSKEGIFSWRMNEMRRKFLKEMAIKRFAQNNPRRTVAAKRNESRYLRHYYLVKTILSMSLVGKPPKPHPSQQLALIQEKILTILYEMLLPTARLVYHYERESQTLQWDGVVKHLGRRYTPNTPVTQMPKVPQGELVTNPGLVQRYPIHGNNAAAYLKQLQAYRRNHLLRTRSLKLNMTPRGHKVQAAAEA